MVSLFRKLLYPLDNINDVAWQYARLLNLRVTRGSLRKAIDEHPDYPSLLALSDVFSELGSETLAAKLTNEQLEHLNAAYIAQIRLPNTQEEFFTAVSPKADHSLAYLHPEKGNWEMTTIADFAKIFTGFALIAELTDNAGEKDFAIKQRLEKIENLKGVFGIVLFPVLILCVIVSTIHLQGIQGMLSAMYLLLFFSGTIITSLLLWYDIDQHNPILRQVCGAGGKKSNCGAILHSKASNFFGISWSLIGFTYFTGATLSLVASGLEAMVILQILAWLSLLAIPYACFSVYYQWRVVNQWCMLCLYTQGILVLQAILVVIANWPFLPIGDFPLRELITLMVLFAFPFVGGQLLVSALKRAKVGKVHGQDLQRLKNNSQIFQSLLSKQKAITVNPSGLGVTLGNPDAKHKIIKVCNPYCGPCATAHPIIEEIIQDNPNVQVQIIFTATDDEKDSKAPPVKHLMAIAEKADNRVLKQALDDWYNPKVKDYGLFAERYPMNGELERQGEKLKAMQDWCAKTTIDFTPTFFVNGSQLPEIYSISDLKYLLKA